MGLAAALGGSDTEVEARLGRRRTELRKYGISDGRPLRSILRTTRSTSGRNSQQKQFAYNLFYQTCLMKLGVSFWTFGMNIQNFKDGFLLTRRLRVRGIRRRSAMARQVVGLLFAIGLAGPAFAEKNLNSVAVTVGDLGNPFFVQIAHGAQDQAKKFNPAVKFAAQSSNYDVNNQANQVDNFISAGDQLLILNAADSKGIAPAVIRAKAAGMTVVAVDVTADGGVDATVTSNNKQAGELAGQYLADRLKGKGQVVIVNGPPVSSIQDRVAGFLEVMKKYPGIKILSQDQNAGGSRDGGLRVMTDLLTAFPKIDAVFSINDPQAVGCDLAAKQAGRKDFFIVSVDGAPEVVPFLKDPTSLIAATAAQDPYTMAEKAVSIGYDIINGKKPASPLTLIPVQLITKDNVNSYQGWTK
jgi:ribose transport system substrate-binding protein